MSSSRLFRSLLILFMTNIPAFGGSVSISDADGTQIKIGNSLGDLTYFLSGNTATLSENTTETSTLKYLNIDEDMEITIRSDSSTIRKITGNIERQQAVQNTIFQQTGNKKKITLNLENVSISNQNGYVVCGINVEINGNNALFTENKNSADQSANVGEGGVIRTTTNFKPNGLSDGASKAGTILITGTNTFLNNSAAKGGAIYSTSTITFSGHNSVSIFRGNTMSGTEESNYTTAGKNDIFVASNPGKGVTFKDSGTYVFDGGIRLLSSIGGNLSLQSGVSVTFEGGAINLISNTTSVNNANLRFENASGQNCLMKNITVSSNGMLTIAAGAQITMGTKGKAISLTTNGGILNIELCDAYTSDTGNAAIVGISSEEDGTSNTLASTSLMLSAADSYTLDLITRNIVTCSFRIFDEKTVNSELKEENIILSDAWKDWEITNYTNGIVTLNYIPEPSTFGLQTGILFIFLTVFRRRRQRHT